MEMTELAAALAHSGCVVRQRESMRRHTSFRIGGPARLFVEPASPEAAAAALVLFACADVPCRVIGNGSNLLVSDAGIDGGVIACKAGMSAISREGSRLFAQSGATLSQLCRYAQRAGLSGLEFAFGIPGSVGGAICMNAGAYGGEMKDVTRTVRWVDAATGHRCECDGTEAAFGYRSSRFQEGNVLIFEASFDLTPADPAVIDARMAERMACRADKQPLDYPSGGSTFKRPPDGYAAELIDRCGLKGLRIGGAMVSEKHAGFIINVDHATCADVLALCDEIRRRVREQTGVELETEIKRM